MSPPASPLANALAARYRLERELGSGGMATVYLAEDVRHHRRIALKVLHPELTAVLGPERFLKEIELTAALQHPHILPLFDSGSAEGQLYYVMPNVEGETLRARLERERQLPLTDALRIATEVADALQYAHERGVVHRDVKPENILLRSGHALVADFGIALAVTNAGGARMTQTGLSLGTPRYMAPEQALGERVVDQRADIYALGAVTYEMLAGEPPFTGSTAQAIVARVLTEPPRQLALERPSVPVHVADAVRIALEKLPADRFSDARTFASALAGSHPVVTAAREGAAARPVSRHAPSLVVAVALALGALAGRRLRPHAPSDGPPARFILGDVRVGVGPGSGILALSPDGRTVVYFGDVGAGSALWVRRIDETRGTVLPDTREAYDPTSSRTDAPSCSRERARRIAFRSPAAIRSRFRGSGQPNRSSSGCATAPSCSMATTGVSSASPKPEGARRGSLPRTVRQASCVRHRWRCSPTAVTWWSSATPRAPRAASTRSTSRAVLARRWSSRGVAAARFLAPDHLVYTDDRGALVAVPFDASALRVTGAPVRLAEAISNTTDGAPRFATSETGALVYGIAQPAEVVLVDRSGASHIVSDVPREYPDPKFSPDGRRILLDVQTSDAERDVWILDLDQHALTRASFAGDGHDAIWSRDGRTIVYMSARPGALTAFRAPAAGGGSVERLVGGHGLNTLTSVAPDGTLIAVATSRTLGSDWDVVSFRPGDTLRDVLATNFAEGWPSLSPDGRWLAYASNESGRPEVYLRRLDGAGGRLQVSLDGATEPVWSPTRRDLYYRRLTGTGSEIVLAALALSPEPRVTGRRSLFEATEYEAAVPHANYDVSPDGQSLVMVRRTTARGLVYLQDVSKLAHRGGE